MKERDGERIENLSSGEPGTIVDMSTSGMALLLTAPRRKDCELNLYINEKCVRVRVIYSNEHEGKYRVGLQFLRGEPEIQAMLPELVDKFSKGKPLTCALDDSKSKL